jgi:hypothetical protein
MAFLPVLFDAGAGAVAAVLRGLPTGRRIV